MPPPINTEPYKGSLCPPPPTHHYHVVPSGLCCFRGGARSSPPPRSPATRWAPRPAPLRLRPWRPGGAAYGEGEGGGFTVNTAPPPPPHRSRRAVLARPLFSGAPARGRCVAGDVCKQTARPRAPLPAWRESSPPPLQKPRPNSPLCNGEGSLGGGGGRCSLGGTVALEGGDPMVPGRSL